MQQVIGHVVPLKNKIEIEIPPGYINKEIEIVIFPVEKKEKEHKKKGSIRSLNGILENVDFKPDMKKEAWEKAVEEKFLSHRH